MLLRFLALAPLAVASVTFAQETPAEASPERARHDGETWGSNLYHFAQRIFR